MLAVVQRCETSPQDGSQDLALVGKESSLNRSMSQQTQAVSDRDGFSARWVSADTCLVQVRCFLLACPSPLLLGAAVFSQPRFPACSCQLSCSLQMIHGRIRRTGDFRDPLPICAMFRRFFPNRSVIPDLTFSGGGRTRVAV